VIRPILMSALFNTSNTSPSAALSLGLLSVLRQIKPSTHRRRATRLSSSVASAVWTHPSVMSDDIMTSLLKKLSLSIKIHAVKPLWSLFGQFPNCRPNPSAVVMSYSVVATSVHTAITPTRRNSTVESRRHRRCVFGIRHRVPRYVLSSPDVVFHTSRLSYGTICMQTLYSATVSGGARPWNEAVYSQVSFISR